MEAASFFNLSNWNPSIISEELYDPGKKGILSIKDFLRTEIREELVKEINEHRKYFRPLLVQGKKTIQKVEQVRLGKLEENSTTEGFPLTRRVVEAYDVLYKDLGSLANFQSPHINSIDINKYKKSEDYITPHQDFKNHRNLISILKLTGKGKLAWCNGLQYTEEEQIDDSLGNLVLLRAARLEEEQPMRPWHYVSDIQEERYTLILRETHKT